MTDEIEQRLLRVSRRLQTSRDRAREHFESSPELSDLREIKAHFNGKVEYVAGPGWEWGRDGRGVPIVPYTGPVPTGRGKAAAMRKREGRS